MNVTIKKITIITNKNKPQQKYFYCGLFVVPPALLYIYKSLLNQ